MTVLVNLSFAPLKPTGWLTYSLNLLPHIKYLGVNVLSPREIPEVKVYQSPANITTECGIKGHFQRLMWVQFKLPSFYKKLNSQLLFSPIPEVPLFSSCLSIVTIHDLIPLRFPQEFSTAQLFYCRNYLPAVIKQSEHIICNSLITAHDIQRFLGVSEKKVTVIPLAIDRRNFRFLDLPRKNYFLYYGRHNIYKNLNRIIAAFAALPNKDYELWLAGPNDARYTPTLQAQVEELGITHRVKFLDYVSYSELPVIINQAIALVFPSLWEGFGFPVLEALACGTPVITSNLSSLPEVAGDAAILINPYNTAEITDAMQTIAHDVKLQSHLSTKGITRANQFSWERTGKATSEVLSRYL
ncbi:glycosyltransferase family 4 protein [Nostoc parmelioides]|uniref:Glycosyltransferase family 4 protein n=1 Tax=Nostoc parmelioides FACHB-3921 TaxID=2692909 RepID=A0ABR8BBJ5_9NOSO|nr:glycosyltransferase family 1 protein [Nostoc parmelioides]MBD2251211.1 glycosyltransferase family 4 protein [Nostoc parmelioides FACHB-3921]